MRRRVPLASPSREFGYVLREARNSRGITATELARSTGVSRKSIWAWERNAGFPNGHWFLALAQRLDLAFRIGPDGWSVVP